MVVYEQGSSPSYALQIPPLIKASLLNSEAHLGQFSKGWQGDEPQVKYPAFKPLPDVS